MRFVGKLTPVVCAAAITAAGIMITSVSAQPEGGAPAQPQQPGRRPGGPEGQGRAPTVEGSMRAMNRAARELRTALADATKKDESLVAVWVMQRACVGAKSAKPGADHLKGENPDKALDDFRRDQIRLMTMLLEVETQILDGNHTGALATLDKIIEARNAAHQKYNVGDDEEEGGNP